MVEKLHSDAPHFAPASPPHLATPGGLRLVSRQTPPAGCLQSRVLLPHVGRERNVPGAVPASPTSLPG